MQTPSKPKKKTLWSRSMGFFRRKPRKIDNKDKSIQGTSRGAMIWIRDFNCFVNLVKLHKIPLREKFTPKAQMVSNDDARLGMIQIRMGWMSASSSDPSLVWKLHYKSLRRGSELWSKWASWYSLNLLRNIYWLVLLTLKSWFFTKKLGFSYW